ncbi:tRNA 5-hydroxyuridine modification protein YegQ [Catenovulum sp. 2E275]|uniref:prephenate-dependent tRNA uridine(34) hydroxylase TrhP n=1 Tax=Catenovulum sp. 2E275 TaxID=2980497 RepID=UPI0021D1CD05|nr:tRNA 5-hydroxyuridine modification protein YegQ [Catenovulum sp. 2E275]MCU4677415.1 tRNA 5-hydroxyuridine modification protein YegQ [Catenovulum sp. 2E275]
MMKPELLLPAGSLKHQRFAFAYGADAVYAGQPRYSLRVRNNEFDLAHLKTGIEEAHALGKQFYVVNNIAPHNGKVKTFLRDIKQVIELKPDALIMSDPGLIMQVREHFPQQVIHLSVQANAVNYATVQFWQKQGIKRVILSRELSLDEIAEIRQLCPDIELEVFVHGALCMAYSGRCLLSGYINKRDPNQGTCTNACRWSYQAHPATEDEAGNIVHIQQPTSDIFLLEEKEKPGQFMPAFEDEHGTYIMNSKDLRAIEHINRLLEIGIDSLKIEGRTKSFYYVARTAQTYRQAIKDAYLHKSFNPNLLTELDKLSNRGYTEGFLRRHTHDSYQNYQTGSSVSELQQLVGEIIEFDLKANTIVVDVKNKFSIDDSLELMTTEGNHNFILEDLYDQNNQIIDSAKGSGHKVKVRLPNHIRVADLDKSILLRNLPKGTDTRAPYKTA